VGPLVTLPLSHGGVTITVQRATFDRFNDATYTDHHDIAGCIDYPQDSTEVDSAVTDRRVVLVPHASDILPTDRVKLGTLVYQVQALPKDWTDPFTGWQPGMQVVLERVT